MRFETRDRLVGVQVGRNGAEVDQAHGCSQKDEQKYDDQLPA